MGIRPSGIREQTRRTPWATQDLMTTITWNFAIAWVYLDAIGWMVKQPTSADLHKNSIGLVIQHIVRANGWEATRLDKVLKYSVSGPSGRFSKSTFPLLKMKTHGKEFFAFVILIARAVQTLGSCSSRPSNSQSESP
ncbi:hypothetical protein RvY_07756-3 [Ramazzottius varieornatus]|uniref:Uncharacterized protein n=1 Tax=Ramazzottius varieornatus TaxID=947166 RepID=A0A1D1V8C3_RAMVA|nr:hypothetical protein RvY_07756-3 [Ramazzottius varieornatus]